MQHFCQRIDPHARKTAEEANTIIFQIMTVAGQDNGGGKLRCRRPFVDDRDSMVDVIVMAKEKQRLTLCHDSLFSC